MSLELHFQISLSGKPAGEKTFRSHDGMTIKAGRLESVGLQLAHASVSRLHALFEFDGETATVLDLGSNNGTSVNGKSISKAKVKHGDEIQIGEFTLVVGIGGPAGTKGAMLAKPAAKAPSSKAALSSSISSKSVSPSGRGSGTSSYDRGGSQSSGGSGGAVIFLALGLLGLLAAGAAVFLLLSGG